MTATHLTIYPYKHHDCWVFDDPRTGLKEEAFVCGATEMISRLVGAVLLLRRCAGQDLRPCRSAAGGREPDLGAAGRRPAAAVRRAAPLNAPAGGSHRRQPPAEGSADRDHGRNRRVAYTPLVVPR